MLSLMKKPHRKRCGFYFYKMFVNRLMGAFLFVQAFSSEETSSVISPAASLLRAVFLRKDLLFP